jgi:hypothetical protein
VHAQELYILWDPANLKSGPWNIQATLRHRQGPSYWGSLLASLTNSSQMCT